VTSAVITVYLPDDRGLPQWLKYFTSIGFEETDWCEMTRPDGAHISYGPCETRTPDDQA